MDNVPERSSIVVYRGSEETKSMFFVLPRHMPPFARNSGDEEPEK